MCVAAVLAAQALVAQASPVPGAAVLDWLCCREACLPDGSDPRSR